MRIGIFFGGKSREREISFAGGRTVYDLLDKSVFTPVPIFVDSLGNFIELDWQYLYKGSIRDFYPPVSSLKNTKLPFQVYIESLNLGIEDVEKAIASVGKKRNIEEIKSLIDFAFLALHGPFGEDGSLQGLFEFYNIPYSGSGILPSAIGIDKKVQKELMEGLQLTVAKAISVTRKKWFDAEENREKLFNEAKEKFELPVVVKSSTQGSSIGISILREWNFEQFQKQINESFFTKTIYANDWKSLRNDEEKRQFIQQTGDIYEGYGIPFLVNDRDWIYHPQDLYNYLETHFSSNESPVTLESAYSERAVLIEEFIKGKEFSCIVVEGEHGEPIALPPTEIIKSTDIFDYRSKYLPGISRKVTPIELPEDVVNQISTACEDLYKKLQFNVYARIDGLITADNKIYLNDPNTTSGMLPSSFFFHQAAEIGVSPSQFLTYIIYKSFENRIANSPNPHEIQHNFHTLQKALQYSAHHAKQKQKIGVVLGGISTERHISVESGRNVYEKLSSSGKYEALPIFLTEKDGELEFYTLPLNLLLKDNADDIAEKSRNYKLSPITGKIIEKAKYITQKFASSDYNFYPKKVTLDELAEKVDSIFIALHGRPGEDGTLQKILESRRIPYNGSSSASSSVTINKFITNELLRENGFLIPQHILITKQKWQQNKASILAEVEKLLAFPCIAKPADDGCSSAVKKVDNREEFEAAHTATRETPNL
ncbi:MAG: D-alanine--D-alanine ligase [Sphingobacteriales bacterium]|nr:MAG: D-alanine--D-alanine ligase [Sphingobacteriales bacterium]